MWLGGGEGCWVLLETILCRTRFRFGTYTQLLDNPKQKPRRGGGLLQINTCRKVPLQVHFLDDDILQCFLSVLFFYSQQAFPLESCSADLENWNSNLGALAEGGWPLRSIFHSGDPHMILYVLLIIANVCLVGTRTHTKTHTHIPSLRQLNQLERTPQLGSWWFFYIEFTCCTCLQATFLGMEARLLFPLLWFIQHY